MTNGTHDILCPPDLAPSGLGARRMAEQNERIELIEFPDIGHADLVECPQDAIGSSPTSSAGGSGRTGSGSGFGPPSR